MYQLHYWPTFTGRVEPILMLLSDAGAGAPPELQTDPLDRLTPCAADFELMRAVEEVVGDAPALGAPAFACPVLRIEAEGFTLAQVRSRAATSPVHNPPGRRGCLSAAGGPAALQAD